jgi:hypothetical protein
MAGDGGIAVGDIQAPGELDGIAAPVSGRSFGHKSATTN